MTCVNQISYDWFIKFQNNYKAEQTENGLVTTLAIRYVYIYLKIASGVTHLLSINLTVGYCTHNIDWKGIILYMLQGLITFLFVLLRKIRAAKEAIICFAFLYNIDFHK